MPFFAFDCEGPITLNDNAFEYAQEIIPEGGRFFKQISRFDDYLADLKKRSDYKAGDTLKLILPFFRLFGANNESLKRFSEKTLLLLPEMNRIIKTLNEMAPFYIISTSYKPYLIALCHRLGFPLEQVFCTEVDLDKVKISESEAKILKEVYYRILSFPDLELPPQAKSHQDLPLQLRQIFDEMEYLFFERLWNLDSGVFLREVNPVGGLEKARACEFISKSLGLPLKEGFYCGDSITDVEALGLLYQAGGVAISFNGNRYALRSAEFYALSQRGSLFLKIGSSFLEGGREAFYGLTLKGQEEEFGVIPREPELFDQLVSRSEVFRKKVRGTLIGELG